MTRRLHAMALIYGRDRRHWWFWVSRRPRSKAPLQGEWFTLLPGWLDFGRFYQT